MLLIKFYRRFISPLKKPCCRFSPSCSKYALDAIYEWGVPFGISLAIWRILRCNPYSKGGYDPVPENPFKRKLSDEKTDKTPEKMKTIEKE